MPLVLVQFVLEECWITINLHELLRGLSSIHIHCSHLLGGLLCSSLGLLRLALFCLNLLELIEHILVMQQCV